MGFVGEQIGEFLAGEVFVAAFEMKLGELNSGARVGVVFEDLLPGGERFVFTPEFREGFGVGHEGVAIIVAGILAGDFLEQGGGFLRSALAEKALAEMSLEIRIGGVAFDGGAITLFRFGELALLKIDVAEFSVMMGLVEMMDLGLEFLDAVAAVGAGEFEAAGGGRLGTVNQEKIEDGSEAREKEHEESPDIFLPADGIDKHPERESGDEKEPWVLQGLDAKKVQNAGHPV